VVCGVKVSCDPGTLTHGVSPDFPGLPNTTHLYKVVGWTGHLYNKAVFCYQTQWRNFVMAAILEVIN
jgi:hypothetical protein